MSKVRSSVLFLTPGASSVGGNIFLLNFLRWFKQNSDIPFITVYGHGGDLEAEFQKLSPAFNIGYDYDDPGFFAKAHTKLAERLRLHERSVMRKLRSHDIGLIYSNAVINHRALPALDHLTVPVISHCHELETLIHKNGIENFDYVKKRTDHFVAVAEAVRQNLIDNHNIAREKIDLVYEFIPVSNFQSTEIETKRAKVIAELGLPENAFIVGGSGTMYWRKAPDLFIQIAAKTLCENPDAPIYFLWIGGARKGDPALIEAAYDTDKLGIKNRAIFLEHRLDPSDYFAAIDVFAMVSREDPFPLVCLETAALSKPIICFENAGGMPEFVSQDCGFVVPYLDLNVFADKIITLYEDPALKERLGTNAALRVKANHDVKKEALKMVELIERYLAS